MAYVDGFVLAVPKQKIEAYKEFARKAGEVWKEYGALAVVECLGDDVPYGELTSFPRAVQAKEVSALLLVIPLTDRYLSFVKGLFHEGANSSPVLIPMRRCSGAVSPASPGARS